MQDNRATITETRIAELEKRLKEKSRELDIQASLERVRVIAMGMKKPVDMPDVCRAISQQLESLGVKEIRNVQTAIFYSEKGTYMNYEFYAKHDKAFVTEVHYTDHTIATSFADQMLKGNGEIFITHMKGKEVKDWLNYQKGTNVFIDTWLEKATSLNYYWYSLGPVALGISTYAPFNENEIELFKRFRNVFELAYRRYLDIEKGEAQAREAQIELGLERVRARAMAMHSSAESKEVVQTLFEELRHLDVNLHACLIATFDSATSAQRSWIIHGKTNEPYAFLIPYNEQPFYQEMVKAWKERNANWSYILEGETKTNWENFLFNDTEFRLLPKKVKEEMHKPRKVFFAASYYPYGAIQASSPELLSNASIDILQRFSKVFNSCYTRFLDLQKAETQAREAQIQLALERVRAKTMAMQSPSEFVDVINVIGEQFIHLGFDFDWVNFSANGLDVSKAIDIWNFVVVPGLYQGATRLVIPFFEHPVFKKAEESVNEYHTSGNSYTVVLLDKKDKDSFLDHLFTKTIYKDLPEEAKTSQYNRAVYQTSNVILKDTWLSVGKYDAKPLTNEEIAILKRLANEFGQAYTRFLDLQKAEAQAREAQIEAALERVRSRTMAMHQTSELQEVIHKVHQELLNLQLSIDGGSFVVINKDIEKELKCWGSGGTADTSEEVVVPDFNMPFCTNLISGIKKGRGFFTEEFSQQEKKKYFTKLFEHVPWSNLSSEEKQITLSSPGGYTRSVAVSKHTAIFIINHQGRKFTEAENDILRRFAKVFEQTYTRFLDLKKAEAQAREAQIQLGLERVRARAMAMLKSDELKELIGTVFTELTQLDLVLTRCVIMIYDIKTLGITWWMANSEDPSNSMGLFVKYHQLPPHLAYIKAWEDKELKWQYVLEGKIKKEWDDFLFLETELSHLPDFVIAGMKAPERVYLNSSFNSFGNLTLATLEPLSDEHADILLRFAKVFDLTYTRFNDLKQAEAQAREAQIETALERVRSRSMAMHKSDELLEVINVVSEQLQQLNVRFGFVTFGVTSQNEELDFWLASPGFPRPERIHMPAINNPITATVVEGQKKELRFFSNLFSAEVTREWIQVLCDNNPASQIMIKSKDVIMSGPGFARSAVLLKNINVFIGNFAMKPLSDEQNAIVIRFANVFEQSYTRFLDLQKAEAQAKESQIQLALERVRARTMAMHQSNQLAETALLLFQQLQELGLSFSRTGFYIWRNDADLVEGWTSNGALDEILPSLLLPYKEDEGHRGIYEAFLRGELSYEQVLDGKELDQHYQWLMSQPTAPVTLKKIQESGFIRLGKQYKYAAIFKQGYLLVISAEPQNNANNLLNRFAKVFEQTYTRFLDLQKAEAQAREAEIELALERVRARTMAMQHSEELQEVVHTVLERLKELNVEFYTAIIILFTEGSKDIIWWLENREKQQYSKILIPYADITYLRDLFNVRENGINHFSKSYFSNEKNELYHHLFEHTDFKYVPEKQKKFLLEAESATFSVAIAKNSGIHLTRYSEKVFSENDNDILKRFANVFEQSYRRFLDLKKAEAQAREAQIEASLERVRGKAMAMHNSNDVSAAASMVFTELRKLGIDPIRCGVGLLNKESRKALLYSATSTSNEDSLSLIGWVILSGHPVLENIYGTWLKQEDYYPELTGEQLESYYTNLLAGLSLPTVPNWQTGEKQYGHFFSFSVGCLYAWSDRHYNESEIRILKRFATIIDLTFRRFLDLQKAEAQAREAQVETALEKVRSRTLAMQKSDELADTSAVLFKQLIHLGIAPNRLYIGIIHDNSAEIEFWITDEDGSKVSSKFTGNALNNPSIKKMYDGWAEQKKWLVIDMHGKELREYFHYLGDELLVPFKGGLSQKRRIQYLTYFSKGFIGMASPDEQPNETVNLLERFAYVFNLTFTRFNDLQIAEAHALQAEQDLIEIKAARKRAEDTLAELQETQKQLIQSEKMASLGELTAGIAHEIQNPLNFVNNFSEVNNELIDEMNEELDKGEVQEAKLIAIDIKQNLEKINHHGKRADAIVKGMLQHSRKSSGQKEPTDINALADEYLRLSYHGLRAKDKNFNATIETDFDNSIGKINIIPQDIGRVLLNLFNNAFYAVNQQKNRNLNSFSKEVTPFEKVSLRYEPTILVSTKKSENQVTITVSDNGNGIPHKILDKIFQPFFTTKPTGEGTGLGLSLSYDIIKAHGGQIKVETKQEEGTRFVIQLPV